MGMKGALNPSHIGNNNYTFEVPNFPPLTVVNLGSLEEEIAVVELPDKTKASSGDTNATEFTVTLPLHHISEEVAMEAWYQEGKSPVSPGYKKPGVITYSSEDGVNERSYTLNGCWITKRVMPEGTMDGEGDLLTTEWTISVDEVIPTL